MTIRRKKIACAKMPATVVAVPVFQWYYTQSASIHIPTHYMNFYSLMDFLRLSLSFDNLYGWIPFGMLLPSSFCILHAVGGVFAHMQLLLVLFLFSSLSSSPSSLSLLLVLLPHAAKGNWRSLFMLKPPSFNRANFVYKSMEISANCISHISVLQTVLQTVQHRSS